MSEEVVFVVVTEKSVKAYVAVPKLIGYTIQEEHSFPAGTDAAAYMAALSAQMQSKQRTGMYLILGTSGFFQNIWNHLLFAYSHDMHPVTDGFLLQCGNHPTRNFNSLI